MTEHGTPMQVIQQRIAGDGGGSAPADQEAYMIEDILRDMDRVQGGGSTMQVPPGAVPQASMPSREFQGHSSSGGPMIMDPNPNTVQQHVITGNYGYNAQPTPEEIQRATAIMQQGAIAQQGAPQPKAVHFSDEVSFRPLAPLAQAPTTAPAESSVWSTFYGVFAEIRVALVVGFFVVLFGFARVDTLLMRFVGRFMNASGELNILGLFAKGFIAASLFYSVDTATKKFL